MHQKLSNAINSAAAMIEIVLGVIILIACLIAGAGLFFETNLPQLFSEPAYLQQRLSDICFIIIGIELIKMISSYTIDSVVDVMLLAIARQMIVEHTRPLENLLAVIAVGLLFVIRKYLYISQIDKRASKREVEEAVRAQVFTPPHTGRKSDRSD